MWYEKRKDMTDNNVPLGGQLSLRGDPRKPTRSAHFSEMCKPNIKERLFYMDDFLVRIRAYRHTGPNEIQGGPAFGDGPDAHSSGRACTGEYFPIIYIIILKSKLTISVIRSLPWPTSMT